MYTGITNSETYYGVQNIPNKFHIITSPTYSFLHEYQSQTTWNKTKFYTVLTFYHSHYDYKIEDSYTTFAKDVHIPVLYKTKPIGQTLATKWNIKTTRVKTEQTTTIVKMLIHIISFLYNVLIFYKYYNKIRTGCQYLCVKIIFDLHIASSI